MVLDTLLCIMLYLSIILSPGEYSMQDIEYLEQTNQTSIDQVHNDPPLEQTVVDTYTPQLEFIYIYDLHDEN